MSGSPVLFVHIGTHKTGTTSIQKLLLRQNTDLVERGVVPWIADGKTANAHALAHSFIRPDLPTPHRLSTRTKAKAAGKQEQDSGSAASFARFVHAEVQRDTPRSCVVSSESFCFLRTAGEMAALRGFMDSLGVVVRVLVMFRNDAAWRHSWRMQLRKMGVLERIAALPAAQSVLADWYFDTRKIVDFWGRVGPVSILDYDAALREDGSILPAFQRAIGTADLRLTEQYFANMTPPDTLADIARKIENEAD